MAEARARLEWAKTSVGTAAIVNSQRSPRCPPIPHDFLVPPGLRLAQQEPDEPVEMKLPVDVLVELFVPKAGA